MLDEGRIEGMAAALEDLAALPDPLGRVQDARTLESGIEPVSYTHLDVYKRQLPESLGEAAELFAGSALMRETLGDHIHAYLVAAKRAEWNEYQGNVSAWERDRYLAVL